MSVVNLSPRVLAVITAGVLFASKLPTQDVLHHASTRRRAASYLCRPFPHSSKGNPPLLFWQSDGKRRSRETAIEKYPHPSSHGL